MEAGISVDRSKKGLREAGLYEPTFIKAKQWLQETQQVVGGDCFI